MVDYKIDMFAWGARAPISTQPCTTLSAALCKAAATLQAVSGAVAVLSLRDGNGNTHYCRGGHIKSDSRAGAAKVVLASSGGNVPVYYRRSKLGR